jgi:quinol monooxygenase YgiN
MHLSRLIFGAAALLLAVTSPAYPEEAPVYVVTYFEVGAPAAAGAANLALQLAEASRKENGNMGFEVFAERRRPERLAMLALWHDKQALDAHGAAAPTKTFHDKIVPLLTAPLDVRPMLPLWVAKPAGGARGAVYGLTHVDVVPPSKDQAVELLKEMAEASRKDPGNLRFDVIQQESRANHFTVVEAWRDGKSFDASAIAAHAKDFRQKLLPMEGALYDQRLYKSVP